jgi:poly(3-hydroxybutyrate) depolymerase
MAHADRGDRRRGFFVDFVRGIGESNNTLATRYFVALLLLTACGGGVEAPLARDSGTADAGTRRDGGEARDGGPQRDAGAQPCDGVAGTFIEQPLVVDGEPRVYWLHVPNDYDCAVGMPLLMDFHGTASDRPEQAYRTAELQALADREGFIVVRPRSRFSQEGGSVVYRWDQNVGDLERNLAFAVQLLASLRARYRIDAARTYASGFSSGTNMTAQLFERPDLFRGFGFVGGGHWAMPGVPPLADDAFRVYAVTGYRDYLIGTVPPMLDTVRTAGLGPSQILFEEADAGHELYGWHFDNLWAWLDRGERPADEPLGAGWTEVDSVGVTLIDLDARDGVLLATSAEGSVYRGDGATWSEVTALAGVPLTGVCLGVDGTAYAVGAHAILASSDFGASWSVRASAPEFGGQWFGTAYLNTIACPRADALLAAGYWSSVAGDATTWRARPMYVAGTFPAQVAAVHVSTASTAVAVGYFYLARAAGEGDFVAIATPGVDWLNDVTNVGTSWWVVGEGGVVLRSDDDAQTFALQTTPIDDDLYAVHFFDASIGMAVGHSGAAILTTDGGQTWRDVGTGRSSFFGGVRWLDALRAIVVGERGEILRYDRTP